jgi:3-(3-hydroxy-phenyl)propionate hydroxylase
MESLSPSEGVAIVGAGPVGACAALFLANRGIASVLIEAQVTPDQDLRASTFHPPTLEMLETIGLAAPLVEVGLITPHWQVRMHATGERALFDLSAIAEDTPYPFRLQCEQSKLVGLALAKAKGDGAVTVRTGVAVAGLTQDANGVTLELGNGEMIRAAFVIGADGARSTVRQAIDAQFEGFTYPETTILATTKFPFNAHIPTLSNVNYCWSDHGTFSLLRLPGLWRCSLYADTDESIEDALQPAAIAAKLDRIVHGAGAHPVDEIRSYRIHQRIVERYNHGRVLLAGDAAHLNSPSGGMGMNGGIHDAWELAETLAAILVEGADLALLGRYTRRRKSIAQEQILAQAHRNRTRMQERDPVKRRAELAALQAIAADPARCRDHLLKTSMIAGLRQAETIS